MPDQSSVTLRALPQENGSGESLQLLISRIIEQKGGFRNVTEASLEEEIRNGESNALESRDDDLDASTSEDGKPRDEQLAAARDQIAGFASQALTESAHALDLVSLILSKHTPRQAELTLSPFLRNALPLGSLGAERVQPHRMTPKQKANDAAISIGWKAQALNNAADSILSSARRLQDEMHQEAEYWRQVLAVKNKGWSICRLPRERHTLGIRYGFLESGPEFRDKGLAAIRRREGGGVELDLGTSFSTPERLRVRLLCNGETIACTRTTPSDGSAEILSNKSIEAAILKARDSIFDSELYHETYREARNLANRGVKCLSDGIALPLEEDKVIFIELVPRDIPNPQIAEDSEKTSAFDKLPRLVLAALRVLLCHAHRYNYNVRTSFPAPLSDRKKQRTSSPILLPILSQLQHRAAVRELQNFIKETQNVLKKAGIDLSVGPAASNLSVHELLQSTLQEKNNEVSMESDSRKLLGLKQLFVQEFVNTLCRPHYFSINLAINPSFAQKSHPKGLSLSSSRMKLSIRTHSMGLEYSVKMLNSLLNSTSPINTTPFHSVGKAMDSANLSAEDVTFPTLSELSEFVRHLLICDLVNLVEARSKGRWIATSPQTGELVSLQAEAGEFRVLELNLDQEGLVLKSQRGQGGRSGAEKFVDFETLRNFGQYQDKSGFVDEDAIIWKPQAKGLQVESKKTLFEEIAKL